MDTSAVLHLSRHFPEELFCDQGHEGMRDYLYYLARWLELYPGTRCEYGRKVVMPLGAAHFLPTDRHRLFLTWP